MMRHRLPPWVILLCLAGVCAGVIGVIAHVRTSRTSTASLLSRFPAGDAVVVFVDFRALRQTGLLGLLSSSKMVQEPEYRNFVAQTGFDYLNDLESVLISSHSAGTYFLVRGRFDWKSLQDYTKSHGGNCYNTLCKIGGSTPERKISYFPVQSNVMGLAVSHDDSAAVELQTRKAQRNLEIPSEPLWSLIPVGILKNSASVPPGTRAFARALGGANVVLLSAAPEEGQITLKIDATCRTAGDARALTDQLREVTARLRDLIAREGQAPNMKDLSGVLASGAFEQKETHVVGRWPLGRDFIANLAGSAL